MQQTQTVLLTVAFGALIAWRMYRRVRRLVGRQAFRAGRAWTTAILFPVLVALIAFSVVVAPAAAGAGASHATNALGALAGGAVLGILLGRLGLHLTRFESTAEGFFYTPNAHLGIALSMLLIVRIAWRYGSLMLSGAPMDRSSSALTNSPLTLLLLGTLAGYYATYAVGLVLAHRRAAAASPSTPASSAP